MDDTQRERLEELRKKDIEREQLAQEDADARELEARELQANLEARPSMGGVAGATMKDGTDFIINNRLGGVYALRRPDGRGIRAWEQASDKQKLSPEWQIGLLRNYIVDPNPNNPQKGMRGIEWAQQCAQWPALLWMTTNAWIELMGVDRELLAKK